MAPASAGASFLERLCTKVRSRKRQLEVTPRGSCEEFRRCRVERSASWLGAQMDSQLAADRCPAG